MSAKEKIREYIDDFLKRQGRSCIYTDEDNIFSKRIVNSLFTMRLLRYLQTEFGLEILEDDMELQNFCSIENIVRFIERKNVTTNEG